MPAYLYVLQGDLTVEFVDGKRQTFRFLAVFLGAQDVPTILHPPLAD